jgi:TM2 domain-containing membrane protein YozV
MESVMSRGTAYGLWLVGLFGICGLHRFYTGRPLSGIIWLMTFGLCLVGQFVDLFLIEGMVRQAQARTGVTAQAWPQAAVQPAHRVEGGLGGITRERVVEREVVRMRCAYCKAVNEGDAKRCGNCAAWL